jgi:DNA-binding transcriptional LysR family regulator
VNANVLRQPRSYTLEAVGLRQLAYLREAARLDSFTAAAESMGVSQPALSQSLAELERRIGVPLFEPAGRNRRLTDDGREVLAFAERVLTDAAGLRDRLDERAQGATGGLRVGMIDAASLYVLPNVIRTYRERHPGVELHVRVDTSNPLMEQLRAFELDVVFAVGPPDSDITGVEVVREPLHIYAPPDVADPLAPPADAEWALYESGSRTRAVIDAGLRRLDIEARVTLESGNPEVLRQMVALGLGWSVLPPAVAEAAMHEVQGQRGALVAERALYAMRRASSAPNPRADALIALATRGSRAARRRPSRAR